MVQSRSKNPILNPRTAAILVVGLFFTAPTVLALDLGPATSDTGLPVPGAAGTQLWESRYDSGADRGAALAVHPMGLLVYAAGTSDGDYVTLAHEGATGVAVWEARFDGPGAGNDLAYGVAVDADGERLFVTGASRGSNGGVGLGTVAYDALSGLELWQAHHPGLGVGQNDAGGVVVSPDGDVVYVTGTTGAWSGARFATVAYDAETGDELWSATYGSAESNARDIAIAPDGSAIYVTGWTLGAPPDNFDYATIAYDTTDGSVLWDVRYDGPGTWYEFVRAVDVSPDGARVYVTGGSIGVGTSFDIATIAYDATDGSTVWLDRYDGPRSSSDNGYDVVVGADDTVYVTGISWGTTSGLDQFTLAHDGATGARVWTDRYDRGASDFGQAIAVNANGTTVYAIGYSWGSNFDYSTLAYDAATGARLWEGLYDGDASGGDFPWDVAVDPLGLRVYTTGWSAGSGDDFATLAYLTG